jgi:uncharacterized protein (DUF433 family)/DNA-binding transcriptional MerR regulator
MYSLAEAARLLNVPQSTLTYWLEGGERRGKIYKPVIRTEPSGSRSVTWAEFVESGLLRAYRNHSVPMAELRRFIELLREEFGVPYPLAHRRPFISGRNLVYEAQIEAGLQADYWVVATGGEQYLLTGPGQLFLERVEWEGDLATGWRPDDHPESPIRIQPDVRFGKPAIRGISTEVLWEYSDDDADVEEIAEEFGLSVPDVRWALGYENSSRAA